MLQRHPGGAPTHDADNADGRRTSPRHTTGGNNSASNHSGVFAEDVDDNDFYGQGNKLADQKILENARIGMAKVNLRSSKSSTRRASATVGGGGLGSILRRRSSTLANTWVERIRQRPWKAAIGQLAIAMRLLDAVYILISVPFRLGFLFDPWNEPQRQTSWNPALCAFTTLDLLGVAIHIWFARAEVWPRLQRELRSSLMCCLRRVAPINQPRLMSVLRASFAGDGDAITLRSQISMASGRGDRVMAADALPFRQRSKTSQRMTIRALISALLNCCPLELVIIVALQNNNMLHLVNLARYPQAFQVAPRVFAEVVLLRFRQLQFVQALSFSSTAAIASLFVAGVYLVHVAASGYMLLAHAECGLGFDKCSSSIMLPGTWVQRDRLEQGTLFRKYIRSMYWGSKTVTTLGQGDLVPATQAETAYRILIQFISGLWATAILTAYSFYFSRKDATMTSNLTTRFEQAMGFLTSRRVSTDLTRKAHSFFDYMQRTRFGVEEELALEGLPPHYRAQCTNYVKYRSLQRLPLFKNKEGAFLRSILGSLEKDHFAPHQVVVEIGDHEEMLVVAKGEINMFDATGAALGRLTPGNAYAESALFCPARLASFRLVADTHCEVWILHQAAFKEALRQHFSKLKYATVMTSNLARKDSMTIDMDSVAKKFQIHDHKATSKIVRTLSSSSPPIAGSSAKKADSWRMPNSRFQRTWKHIKCALLMFQLYEVPYQIAYQRGFGLTNDPSLPIVGATPRLVQELEFYISAVVELFFLLDWIFRACFFWRFVVGNSSDGAVDSNASFGVLKEPSMILRHYRENENVILEFVQHLPLPLVWDILPKDDLSNIVIYVVRFIRMLRLVRLHQLHSLLRSLMVDHALAPSKRLLVYVVIFCTSSAHIAACLFFLIGDQTSFRGGLPVSGVRPNSISAFECLQDASLFHNCTWYIYDRSTFDIDAPFLRALQWSIVLQSTVGFGEIVSFSTRECLIGCLWIFIGANICYCIGCVLSSILGQLDIQNTIRHARMEEINLALQSASNISAGTKVMIRSYYDTKWELNGCAKRDVDILVSLPRSLRYRVLETLYLDDLRSCYLFAEQDPASPSIFIRELARITRSEIFLKYVMVVREGHLAADFYVIQRGEVELLLSPLVMPSSSVPSVQKPRQEHIQRSPRKALALGKLAWANPDASGSLSIIPRASNTRLGDRIVSSTRQSVRESIASSRASMIHSHGMKLSSLDLRLPLRRRRESEIQCQSRSEAIPISILQRHDCFGEESLTPAGNARTYQINVRVVATAHLAVIHRHDLVALAARFPDEFTRIFALLRAKTDKDEELFNSVRVNFMFKDKVARRLGIPKSLYVDRTKLLSSIDAELSFSRLFRVVDPDEAFARWWYRVVSTVVVYNFYQIIFRVAFLPNPSTTSMIVLTVIDCTSDLILYADIVLKYGWLGYIEHGEKIMSKPCIREQYANSWLKQDCWSMLPTFYVGNYFIMTLCRLPRLLRSTQLMLILDEVHGQILEHFLRGNKTKMASVFDLFRFVLIFVSTAHYVGSLYYLLGRLQLEWGLVERSWVNVDYILLLYPDNVWVHYMRSLYWCLSTFTVDCFGDILARNVLETLYSMSTCILGWIFIGQVIGRINFLMITLDKEAQQHQTRVEDFDQYANQRKLPHALRLRALQSLSFKSDCLIPLRLTEIFQDLPKPLRYHLFNEMYSPLLRTRREFEDLTDAQVEAIASALRLEIYLPGDQIYECGRTGTTLFIMQHGCAEVYSPRANIVFSAIETGALFGEVAFFIPGAKRLASARAVRSCQVLQLHRHQWCRLWPDSVRAGIETKICKVVRKTYRDTACAYLHMTKYFYMKNENVKPPRSVSQRRIFQLRLSVLGRHIDVPKSEADTTVAPAPVPQQQRPSLTGMLYGQSPARPSSPTNPPIPPTTGPLESKTNGERELVRQNSGPTGSLGSTLRFLKGERGARSISPSPGSLQRQSSTSSGVSHSSPDHSPTRRPSTSSAVEGSRRKSSLTVFAEALGLRDTPKPRPTSGVGRLPPLTTVHSDRQLVRRESWKHGHLPKLSAATQLRWKRHEKRLAAIRMFRVAFARVEKDLEVSLDRSRSSSRRASVSGGPPMFAAGLDEERAKLRSRTMQRRHSIQVDSRTLLDELLAFDAFETEDHGDAREDMHESDPWDDADDEDQDELRPAHTNDSSGSFTISTFLMEITKGSRRTLRNIHKNRVAPSDSELHRAKQSHEIWVPSQPGPEMFRENSRFRQTWDTIMLFVTVYYAVIIPFRACFLHDHMDDPRFGVAVATTFGLEYMLTDVPCLLDFVLRRHHFEYTEDGETVSEPTRIAAHYWKDGTCFLDALSLVPIEVIGVGLLLVPGQSELFSSGFFTPEGTLPIWRALAFGRVNRALRLLVHLHSLSDRVQRFVLYDLKVSWLRPSVCYVIRLGLDFALGTHWITCLFFGGSYLLHEDNRPSWLTTPGMLMFDETSKTLEDVSRIPVLTKYLRSFHFSIGAVTTVCYGDILPMSALENVLTIVVIFVSVGLFSMLSGGFFKFFEMELGKRADYEEKVHQMGKFMVFHQFPSRTWKQMQVYFALSWQESKGMYEEEMLRGLTKSMRREIAYHVHANLLQHVKLLNMCDPPFARALLAVLQHELYVRNDVIIQRGDHGRSMYIIESGLVSIRRPETKKHRPSGASATTNVSPSAADRARVSSVSKLRGTRLIIRDLHSAAKMAVAAETTRRASASAGKPSFIPPSPTDQEMVQALQRADDQESYDPSHPKPTLKLRVAPKVTTRSASGILAPPTAISAPGKDGSGSGRGSHDVRFVKGPFDYFGERSLLFGTPRMATCVALCVCSVYVLTLEQYERLLEQYPTARRKNIEDWVLSDRKLPPGALQ